MATAHPQPARRSRKTKSTPARAVLIAAGTLGLAAMAVAIIGPQRLLRRAESERAKLARDVQSWVRNFRKS